MSEEVSVSEDLLDMAMAITLIWVWNWENVDRAESTVEDKRK